VTHPPPGPLARILLITEDDDIGEPLEELLRRAGYSVTLASSAEGAAMLAERGAGAALPGGRYPDALILDRDLPVDRCQRIGDLLAPRAGPASFPLIVIGGGPAPLVPDSWHEDARASVSRPPQPGEILATLSALLRLVFYRRYRDLVHDLAQPVMTLHALGRGLAKLPAPDEAGRLLIERLVRETERLMSLMETFQRGRGAS
jgi:hypothetical protein